MATSKSDNNYPETIGYDPAPIKPRSTSITARTVLLMSVTMSPIEMDTLVELANRGASTEAERTIAEEFTAAVMSLR